MAMRYQCSLLATVVLLAAAAAPAIGLTDVPAAAQIAINAQLAGGKLDDIAQTNDDGETVFDVSFTALNGDERDFTVAADGTMVSKKVFLDAVTPRAAKTITEKIAGGKILRIDETLLRRPGGALPYEVHGRKNGKPFDFSVGRHGGFMGMDD